MKWPRWLYCFVFGHFVALDTGRCTRCGAEVSG